jgi:ferric-dicitrate binding protein FerR (iron transport regulator)
MTEEIIDRFFKKDCTADEAYKVVSYFKENPVMLENYLSREEWDRSDPVQMDNDFWNDVWSEMQHKKNASAKNIWLKMAIAAAFVVIFSAIALIYLSRREVPKQIASHEPIAQSHEQKIVLNSSAKIIQTYLPDSSLVMLSPGSVIVYYTPFEFNKRDISLDGKARFRVTHDRSKPFTVFAGGLATTALGTEFTINTREKSKNHISVKLHDGKVVIKPSGISTVALTQDIFLYSGQQLDYSESEKLVTVGDIKKENVLQPSGSPAITKISNKRKAASLSDTLSFVNTFLPDVINKLSDHYHVRITYDHSDIKSMNFTGTITKNDSLDIVLKVISQMNELEVSKNGNSYHLKKFHE